MGPPDQTKNCTLYHHMKENGSPECADDPLMMHLWCIENLSLSLPLSLCHVWRVSWAKWHLSLYTLTPSSLNFPCLCHFVCISLYLFLFICHCHCHRWGILGSTCHQLSENKCFYRWKVVLPWLIRLWRWSAFLAPAGRDRKYSKRSSPT